MSFLNTMMPSSRNPDMTLTMMNVSMTTVSLKRKIFLKNNLQDE